MMPNNVRTLQKKADARGIDDRAVRLRLAVETVIGHQFVEGNRLDILKNVPVYRFVRPWDVHRRDESFAALRDHLAKK